MTRMFSFGGNCLRLLRLQMREGVLLDNVNVSRGDTAAGIR